MTMSVCADAIDSSRSEDARAALPPTMTPHAIAVLFQRADLALYGDAWRDFLLWANIGPVIGSDHGADGDAASRMRRAFEEWFAFDCEIDERGKTPFDLAARYRFNVTRDIDRSEYANLRRVSASNRASWFRILSAEAVRGVLMLEDLASDQLYEVRDRRLAGELDGVRGGSLVARIAMSHGEWRLVGEPLHMSRRGEANRAHVRFCQLLNVRQPRFADLVRFFHGRDAGRHVGYDVLRDYERAHGVETIWAKLSRGLM
ncbi:hypothetical protein BLEM_0550 [Bifidobacterium lemurum]|uniref:Uncharacterized protein n=1 Tax=Bifidobacterium lemurum TaxID=1603886 RepID=A0A261FUL8_9BIFI|nr:hypothetical protein [Bifidobacterium lemurum]OZG62633.1 hypothetical protein BLEM_0550 [Bifidobacterium lemurum]QOL34645.1 hypothetical protein BL8807_01550 [Bifidobacterium lemurum]